MDSKINIATIGRPHGVSGWVHVYLHNAQSVLLELVETVELRRPNSAARELKISTAKPQSSGWLVKFDGFDSRDTAKTLTNCHLFVDRTFLDELADDEFYHDEIVGFAVISSDGSPVGTVSAVVFTTVDIFEIKTPSGTYLVPVVDDFVERIDRDTRTVIVRELDDNLKTPA